jgi:hypothetical protein
MFKMFLAPQQKDVLMERIEKVGVLSKYNLFFTVAIACSFATIVIGSLAMWRFASSPPPVSFAVNVEKNEMQQLITLPYPHQSFKIVSKWIEEAVMDSYSFDFNNFDERVDKMEYYFTEEGYAAYRATMYNSGVKEQVIQSKIKVTTVVTGSPIMISGGEFMGIEYWRFSTPVRVSFYGGDDPKPQDMLVNMLLVRIPTHKNSKGLGIAEFSMKPV